MKKILTVIGARPQFVKAAPVSRALRKQFNEIIVNTGQHYDYNMAGIFFEELNIPKPDYDLGVGSASHGEQTGNMLIKLEEVIFEEKPDAVLVYGDTNSTVAAALAASKLHIPLFHIEAGLRSYNKRMPEEINRVMTDHVSNLLFAPTTTAVDNLKKESITEGVHLSGDVMYDAVLYNMKIAEAKFEFEQFGIPDGDYILGTIHRAENTDDPQRLAAIFQALSELDTTVILPIHPRTKKKIESYGLGKYIDHSEHIHIIEPVSYLAMLFLEKHAKTIITDSGGVQKEAYFAKVPCFTLRDQTEWVETVQTGWNTLVNPLETDLKEAIKQAKTSEYVDTLYGDGDAAGKISDEIAAYFTRNETKQLLNN